jgi:hypothetical protein
VLKRMLLDRFQRNSTRDQTLSEAVEISRPAGNGRGPTER